VCPQSANWEKKRTYPDYSELNKRLEEAPPMYTVVKEEDSDEE